MGFCGRNKWVHGPCGVERPHSVEFAVAELPDGSKAARERHAVVQPPSVPEGYVPTWHAIDGGIDHVARWSQQPRPEMLLGELDWYTFDGRKVPTGGIVGIEPACFQCGAHAQLVGGSAFYVLPDGTSYVQPLPSPTPTPALSEYDKARRRIRDTQQQRARRDSATTTAEPE